MAARAAALLESTGGLEGWVDSTNSENLRRQGVSEARAARLLAAAEIARRTRTARRPRFEAITRSALELVAVTLEAIVDDPSSHEVGLCIEMIRALQRTSFTLAQGLASAGPLSGELLDQLDDQTL